jgi:CHAT domain-containing protein/Tfp pilus assembly protein PilF
MKLQCACAALLLFALYPSPSRAQESRLQDLNTQVAQLVRQGKFADAVPLAAEALKVAETTFGPDSAQAATALGTLGLTYYYQRQYAQAEPLFERAVRTAEKATGPDSPELASDLGNLALDYAQQGRVADAIPLLERTVSIYEKSLGPDNPKVAMALNGLAALYVRQAKYAQAEQPYQRALAILEKALGPGNPDRPELVPALNNLADLYVREGKDAQAEPLYQRILAIYEKAFGPDHLDRPEVAGALNHLGDVYLRQEKYAQAGPLYQRVLGMYEKALGPNDPTLAYELSSLALVYLQTGKYADSEALYQRALSILEKVRGPEHPDVAQALNNLADLYREEGRYTDAEALYRRALGIREKALGPDDPDVAHTLNNLGVLFTDEGRYDQAESFLQRSQRIIEKALGPESAEVGADLNNLATVYVHEGKFAEAEPLLQRSQQIVEKVFGLDNPIVAKNLNNLAELYEKQGKFAAAEPLLKRSLSIREKAEGPDHPDVAAALANLAQLYQDQNKYAEAKPLYLRALSIEEKALGPDHPTLATTYQNVAVFLMQEGSFAQAEVFYRKSLAINEKILGPDHPEVGSNLDGLALVYGDEGKYDAAEPLHLRAIRIKENAFGPDHPEVGLALMNLAEMYDDQGKYALAEPVYSRANDNLFHQFQYSFTYMTEQDRLSFLDKVSNNFQAYFSFVHRFHAQDPQLIGSMYNLLLWEKGFVAGSVANMRRQVEASGDTQALTLLAQLTEERTQIAALLNVQPANSELWRKQVEQLEAEANDIEKALVARSSAFAERKKLERATWQQVRDALKPGEAAVEFARFRYHDKQWTGASYYAALVVTRDSKDHPQYIFLGDDKQIESDAIAHFQHSLQIRGFLVQPEAAVPGPHAYDLIWKPLDAVLAGIARIDLSPDGGLNELPLGIIPTPDGKLLMEKYDLRLVSSTRDILRSAPPRAAIARLALPARVPEHPTSPIVLTGLQSRGDSSSATLPALPGTGQEVSAIATLMQKQGWKIAVYTGDEALKTVVEQTSSPRVIHLATHGFFLPDQQIKPQQSGAASGQTQPSALDDPMLRSGLYFAAADRTLAGKPSSPGLDNGVLTALEAGNLNLTGTRLVVLSACDTGQGDVKNGEGVFGLRRALEEAGAESVLMSLWSVPDKETLELMQRFYAKWLAGAEIHQALKEAQLEMRDQVKLAHDGKDLPYYWGAFVLVGR